MLWKKPADLKYTDLCIYIDENVPKIAEPNNMYPEIEDTVYNYLWLLVKALAIKKRMFQNFTDYDGYAFYSASRLYFALKKNYLNQGKIIKGKEIKPIKSCLNYTKALLYPMKVEYQRDAYAEVIDEEFVTKKFDSFSYAERLKDEARQNQPSVARTILIKESFASIGYYIDNVLQKSPFKRDSLDYKKVKMSILLNFWASLKEHSTIDWDPTTAILWKLPKSMSSYVKVILKQFYTTFKTELLDCYTVTELSDELATKLISTPDGEYKDNYEDD